MRRCEDCKIILDDDVRFCPKCGKDLTPTLSSKERGQADVTSTLSSKERGRLGSPPLPGEGPGERSKPIMDVPKLLAAVKLHTSREEWDEAIAAATEALRMEPKNADVAVSLGSVYEERDMFDEALVWYQMALELDPASGQGKAGRDRIGMLVSARRKAAAAAPKAMAKSTRYIAAGVGALLLLTIVLLMIFAFGGRHRPKATSAAGANPPLNAPVMRPGTRLGTRPPVSASPGASSAPLSGAAIPTGSSKGSSLRTAAEEGIRSGLSSDEAISATGATVDDVIADPRAGVATVTFSVPLKGIVTREQITRAAVAVARKAFQTNQNVRFVTARCVVQAPGSEGTQVAFVGDIARESAAGNDQQVAAAFSHPWWNPQIK